MKCNNWHLSLTWGKEMGVNQFGRRRHPSRCDKELMTAWQDVSLLSLSGSTVMLAIAECFLWMVDAEGTKKIVHTGNCLVYNFQSSINFAIYSYGCKTFWLHLHITCNHKIQQNAHSVNLCLHPIFSMPFWINLVVDKPALKNPNLIMWRNHYKCV